MPMEDARPSHARRPKSGSKRGRGVVKGYAVSKRIRDNENGKLSLLFSKRLGGVVGVNRRAFVDEVGVQVRQHVPIVGIEKWDQVTDTPKQIIKKKNIDTGEEPNDLELWYKTHTKSDDEWASETAKEIYENVSRAIAEKENELGDSLPSENIDKVFQLWLERNRVMCVGVGIWQRCPKQRRLRSCNLKSLSKQQKITY